MRSMFTIAMGLLAVSLTGFADSKILIEAESFADKGGWSVDQQFVEQMGSPYLLAHGLGKPVKNASTSVKIPETGSYQLWVRTKNWVPGDWKAPGRFRVHINDSPLKPEFGVLTGWQWQDGGTIKLAAGDTRIELEDLTGFDGRCDAIYLTTDSSDQPPNDLKTLRPWRDQLLGIPAAPPSAGKFDVVIVGGGIAGCAAALAASEQGLTVALVHDRAILGGNASSEIRVHTIGITGYSDRILKRINSEHWPNGSELSVLDDRKRHATMDAATGVRQFLCWRAYGVETNGNRIVHVNARHTETGEVRSFSAPVFVDCTGDAWIGYWAGAEYRYGREASSEFGENWGEHGDQWSPKARDNRVMGVSLLWNTIATSKPTTFPSVPWAEPVAMDHAVLKGEWYWEYSSNELDMIKDAEQIRDHVLRAIYGTFANAKKNTKYSTHVLKFVGYVSGKRESRRLVGDHTYTLNDMVEGRSFPDSVVTETRDVDLHFQRKYKDGSYPYDFLSTALFKKVPRYYIPFRSLYSKNIENLMMAGRCFSCSHAGLGGPRVMNTCGQMGAATGYAAALIKKYKTTPRGVYQKHLDELLQLVLPPPSTALEESVESARRNQIVIYAPGDQLERIRGKYEIVSVPPAVRAALRVIPQRGNAAKPAPSYQFTVNTPVEVWIAVHKRGKLVLPAEWEKTDSVLEWELGPDTMYRRKFPAGVVTVPGNSGKEGNSYGFPHLAFVLPTGAVPAAGFRITNPMFESSDWENLFAPDLSNATFPKGIWYIEKGLLTASEDQCIWTKKQYENFTLDLEFKMGDAANSGVIVYCSDRKNWIPNSVEIQILDDSSPKWANAEPTWKCGALFGHSVPKKQAVKKAGEWNRMTVTCKGQQIRVVLNGAVVTDANLKNWTSAKKNPDGSDIPPWLNKPFAELATKGHIGLQGKHSGAPIYFRSVKIKPLD